jgi:predicted RNase H-like nuclease (RuvC/YqgF family)
MAKKGYQPMKTTVKPIPPNTGSNIHMKKDGYTWEDLDRSYWEGFDNVKNKMEKRIEELEQENAELKEELKNWKDEWQEQVQKATDEGYARTQQTIQLTKAKEHIKQLLDCLKQDTNDPETNYYVCQYMDKAEQFLKEIEK